MNIEVGILGKARPLQEFEQMLRRLRLLTAFVGLEVACQACDGIAAILVVHNMTKEHYAWYSLANNLQGTLSVFTLMGIGTGLMSMGGQWIGDRHKMGRLAASAVRYRTLLLALAAPFILPFFGVLLLKNGCPAWEVALLVVVSLLRLTVEFNRQIASTPMRLAGKYNLLQKASLAESVLRLLGIFFLFRFGKLDAFGTMLLSAVVAAGVVHLLVARAARPYLAPHCLPDRQIGRDLTKLNLNVMPSTLSATFQAQVGMALISFFGRTSAVADLGALTRVNLLAAVPAAVLSKIIEPQMAKAVGLREVQRRFLTGLLLAAAMGLSIFCLVLLMRGQILWLLGPQYQHLGRELLFFCAIKMAWLVAGQPQMLLYARGWVAYMWLTPAVEVLGQAATIPFVNLATPMGVLTLEAVRMAVALLINGVLVFRRWNQLRRPQHSVPTLPSESADAVRVGWVEAKSTIARDEA